MGLLDSIKNLLGDKAKTDQLKDLADTNDDGKVDMADFNKVKDAVDVNDDGSVDQEDLRSIKQRIPGQS